MSEFTDRQHQNQRNPSTFERNVRQLVRVQNSSSVQSQTMGNQANQQIAQACPIFPNRCPFGGVCHTCPARVQTKLTINEPGDKYEQEADRVAEQVMSMPEPRLQRQVDPEEEEEGVLQTKPLLEQITPLVQRQEGEPEEEEEEPIQTKAASGRTPVVTPEVQAQIDALGGGGRPLPESTRAFVEPRFGCDFSYVRIHDDPRAARIARSIQARAFTLRQDVAFGAGQYSPESEAGQRLLAHELTHVVQQRNRMFGQSSYSTCQIMCRTARKNINRDSPWQSLPAAARKTLKHSFDTKKPKHEEWIWWKGATEEQCFDRLRSDRRDAFSSVYNALAAEGLWSEVLRVKDFWPRPVRGIKFDAKSSKGLMSKLIASHRFCEDTRIGGSKHSGVMWRQVVAAGSEGLHIGVRANGLAGAHLDTIAPVAGREPNGQCRYSMRHVLPHISRELWGWRYLELFPVTTGKFRRGSVQPWLRIYIPGT